MQTVPALGLDALVIKLLVTVTLHTSAGDPVFGLENLLRMANTSLRIAPLQNNCALKLRLPVRRGRKRYIPAGCVLHITGIGGMAYGSFMHSDVIEDAFASLYMR